MGGGKKARGLFKLAVLLGAELLFMCGGGLSICSVLSEVSPKVWIKEIL